MSAFDTNFRLHKRVTLNVAALYLPSYFLPDDHGTLKAARTLLEAHNIGLRIWPYAGEKTSVNTLLDNRYRDPIPHRRDAYQQLRKDVNARISNRATGYPFLVPVIFCQFIYPGHGITPPESKIGAQPAACLISPNPQKDRMTVLHEMGHSAQCHHMKGKQHAKNVMHERDGRDNLYKTQVEMFSKAFFARY